MRWRRDLDDMIYDFERIRDEQQLEPAEQIRLKQAIHRLKQAREILTQLYPGDDHDS